MFALLVTIEISDQMGKDEIHLVGVFINRDAADAAKKAVEARYNDRRLWWNEQPFIPDVFVMPKLR